MTTAATNQVDTGAGDDTVDPGDGNDFVATGAGNDTVRGLTTAASVWMTAAIGVAAGMGREATAILSALFGLVILSILRAPAKKAGEYGKDDRDAGR